MRKIVGGVIGGYAVMAVGVMVLMGFAWMITGANRAFQADTWDVSLSWMLIGIVVGVLAAVAGGYVCMAIAKDTRAVMWLLVVVLVIGLTIAVMTAMTPPIPDRVRPMSLGMFEAMRGARQPVWLAFLNPVIGVIGVVIGARLHRTGNY
jgi:ABC-type Na+ efflux pump permease subunit